MEHQPDVQAAHPNTEINLLMAPGRLIVAPHPRPRYMLAELIGQCDLSVSPTADDRAWLETPRFGREAL